MNSSPSKTKSELRQIVAENLEDIVLGVNDALRGKHLKKLKVSLARLGRSGQLPHWFEELERRGTLPNLDGKTIGSVVEMLLVAVLETGCLAGKLTEPMKINPARGIDLPDLELGIKSPSTNYCTSEPFFSAYERIIGNNHDAIILLTDYQSAKNKPPLKLSIVKHRYLTGSQVADKNLCQIAKSGRDFALSQGVPFAKRFFQFLCYVNQSNSLAKDLVKFLTLLADDDKLNVEINRSIEKFKAGNAKRAKKHKELLPECDLLILEKIRSNSPLRTGVMDACTNWLADHVGDARLPSDFEFAKIRDGKLDGEITVSFALQWRFNFSRVFGAKAPKEDEVPV